MKLFYKIFLIFMFLIQWSYSIGQIACVKVLEVDEVAYYYVYSAFNFSQNDTIILLGSKLDEEFKTIKLDKNNLYKIKTRLRSAIKVSDEKYIFSKHAITTINDIQISNKNQLPILILDYKKVNECPIIKD